MINYTAPNFLKNKYINSSSLTHCYQQKVKDNKLNPYHGIILNKYNMFAKISCRQSEKIE